MAFYSNNMLFSVINKKNIVALFLESVCWMGSITNILACNFITPAKASESRCSQGELIFIGVKYTGFYLPKSTIIYLEYPW